MLRLNTKRSVHLKVVLVKLAGSVGQPVSLNGSSD
jgi:hypothetical protein